MIDKGDWPAGQPAFSRRVGLGRQCRLRGRRRPAFAGVYRLPPMICALLAIDGYAAGCAPHRRWDARAGLTAGATPTDVADGRRSPISPQRAI